ncbi:hypothetical protein J4449_00520 [Candidatus Woesearchaeota archaeon]|nr:hypothetical protein [Candidatus Woesearchaeota archaeon]
MPSPLEIAVNFLKDFGFFDILLPFLLVFTIVFAILEKTMILGQENNKPKKNINAMVAFSIALFVVAASNIVAVLQQSLPMVTLVLIVIVSFMLLMGSFMGTGEFSFKDYKYTKYFLVFFLIVGISLIFLGAIESENGDSWLRVIWDYVQENWFTGPAFSGIIFLIIIVLVIIYVLDAFPGAENH